MHSKKLACLKHIAKKNQKALSIKMSHFRDKLKIDLRN